MKVIIETIPHDQQRYDTVGDWSWEDVETLCIKVSAEMPDIRMSFLVAIHELVEALQCRHDGVTEKEVDEFDLDPETMRYCKEFDIEPGDHPISPYRNQHCLATGVERILCSTFGLNWAEYEDSLNELSNS